MDIQEYKDYFARDNGYADWEDLRGQTDDDEFFIDNMAMGFASYKHFQFKETTEEDINYLAEKIIINLDEYARDVDVYDYGLPTLDTHVKEMEKIIVKILNDANKN